MGRYPVDHLSAARLPAFLLLSAWKIFQIQIKIPDLQNRSGIFRVIQIIYKIVSRLGALNAS